MEDVLVVAFGYLLGSVPFAFLLARRGGIDLRETGSGNVGATNVLRTRGLVQALMVVGLDAAKGMLAVIMAQRLGDGPATPVVAGLAAVIGHIYPVWLRFRGGKGVATTGGMFAVLVPVPAGIAIVVFVLMAAATRYVSAGSVAGAVTLTLATIASGAPRAVAVGSAIAAVMIIYRHRDNLGRLAAGTERRIGQRV